MPAFRSLSWRELETIVKRMVRKEYRSGEVLWRAGIQPDFLGIIQSGEIFVEYRYNGSIIRSVRLVAGECIQPRAVKGTGRHSSIFVRAVTDVALHVLRMEEPGILPPPRPVSDADIRIGLNRRHVPWRGLWTVLVAVMIVLLTWRDMTRILSGALYLASSQAGQTAVDSESSMRLLEYAEQLDQDAFFAYNQQGYLWFQHGDLQDAEAAFSEAVTIEQSSAPALNNLAAVYFTRGQGWQALILQQDAVRSNPDHAVVQYNLGLLLLEQNASMDAIRAFREASYINPEWALPYLQDGFIHLQMQDYVQAERAARATIQKDPTQESAHFILAVALYNQGQYQEAQESVKRALQINPNDSVARFYQALILGKLGETDSALVILHQLLQSSSDARTIARIESEIEALHRSIQDHAP